MLRIYDCSGSSERPASRNYGGPIVNEFVALLHKYAEDYDCVFVDNPENAEVIFTNDIYPTKILEMGIPRIKRMDGIYWQLNTFNRNFPHVEACWNSQHVIFITEYAKCRFEEVFIPPANLRMTSSVQRHWTESLGAYRMDTPSTPTEFCCIATNWARPEKRLFEVVQFALTHPEVNIHLIGACQENNLPGNIKVYGYFDGLYGARHIIANCHAFLNLTWKDAATKTVCTAINCGLPVLYANSGGVSEMVGSFGVPIFDGVDLRNPIVSDIPGLNSGFVKSAYSHFLRQYSFLCERIDDNFNNRQKRLNDALSGYFDDIRNCARKGVGE